MRNGHSKFVGAVRHARSRSARRFVSRENPGKARMSWRSSAAFSACSRSALVRRRRRVADILWASPVYDPLGGTDTPSRGGRKGCPHLFSFLREIRIVDVVEENSRPPGAARPLLG